MPGDNGVTSEDAIDRGTLPGFAAWAISRLIAAALFGVVVASLPPFSLVHGVAVVLLMLIYVGHRGGVRLGGHLKRRYMA